MRHLASLVLPLLTLQFVATGPHPPWQALLGLPVAALVVWLDFRARPARELPSPPRAGFTLLVVLLALIQLATMALFVRMVALSGFTWDLVLVGWFVGNNSGWGTIVVAHELIHRRSRPLVWLGRALLWTVLYDHFHVEHVRGHHVRVATGGDPATARFGETYHAFMRRTVVGQFRSAWRLDRAAVVTGLVIQALLLAGVFAVAGWVGLAVFVWQAYSAVALLEAVNYFEHWGLVRKGARPGLADAWDAESWLTHYTLIGLARHADHHTHAALPYQALARVEASPKLPYGYYAMVTLAQLRNRRFVELMTDELHRRRLGPFGD
jgi:alkane 1-monooxygenase